VDRWTSRPLTALIVIALVVQHRSSAGSWPPSARSTRSCGLPGADNSLLMLEHASCDELRATGDSHREIREAAVDDQAGCEGQRT
jgi:hypothetical protein